MSRTYTYFAVLIGAICVYFIIRLLFFTDLSTRTVPSDVIQGFLIGFGLAFVSAQVYARIKATKVNGWITMFGLGVPGNGMLLRAAHAQLFPGPGERAARGDVLVDARRWRGSHTERPARLRAALPIGWSSAQ